jgi:hypothetical protein
MYGRAAKGHGTDLGGQDRITRNQTMQDAMSASNWKAAYQAMRATQKGRTGIYNPQTGNREYGAHTSGPKKDMQGHRYRG